MAGIRERASHGVEPAFCLTGDAPVLCDRAIRRRSHVAILLRGRRVTRVTCSLRAALISAALLVLTQPQGHAGPPTGPLADTAYPSAMLVAAAETAQSSAASAITKAAVPNASPSAPGEP